MGIRDVHEAVVGRERRAGAIPSAGGLADTTDPEREVRPMVLYTIDEARRAFCSSALRILGSVRTENAALRIIPGPGDVTLDDLSRMERALANVHWDLVADLIALGYEWALDGEIEGITSCVEAEGLHSAYAIIQSELGGAEDYVDVELVA